MSIIYKIDGECQIKVTDEMRESDTCPQDIINIMKDYPFRIMLKKDEHHLHFFKDVDRNYISLYGVGPYANSNTHFNIEYDQIFIINTFWNVAKNYDMFVDINHESSLIQYKDKLNTDNRVIVTWEKCKEVHWSDMISSLVKNHPDWIDIRYTDHEYRKDERNITYVKDYPLDTEVSVESLYYKQDNHTDLPDHIIHLCTGIDKDKVHELYTVA